MALTSSCLVAKARADSDQRLKALQEGAVDQQKLNWREIARRQRAGDKAFRQHVEAVDLEQFPVLEVPTGFKLDVAPGGSKLLAAPTTPSPLGDKFPRSDPETLKNPSSATERRRVRPSECCGEGGGEGLKRARISLEGALASPTPLSASATKALKVAAPTRVLVGLRRVDFSCSRSGLVDDQDDLEEMSWDFRAECGLDRRATLGAIDFADDARQTWFIEVAGKTAGYFCLTLQLHHRIQADAQTCTPEKLPCLCQLFVKKEYRRLRVATEAIRLLLASNPTRALVVEAPAPPTKRLLQGLSMRCAGSRSGLAGTYFCLYLACELEN